MQERILKDFEYIYRNTIDGSLLIPLANHIESILVQHQDKVKLETTNEKGQLLGYFTFKSINKKKSVIFAGGRDPDESGQKRSSIRFRGNNNYLKHIPEIYKYPFQRNRKEYWICVEINRETIHYLPLLMDYEVDTQII